MTSHKRNNLCLFDASSFCCCKILDLAFSWRYKCPLWHHRGLCFSKHCVGSGRGKCSFWVHRQWEMLHIIAANITKGFFFAQFWTSTLAADSEGNSNAWLFMIYAEIIGEIGRNIRSSAMRVAEVVSGVFLNWTDVENLEGWSKSFFLFCSLVNICLPFTLFQWNNLIHLVQIP